MLTLNIKFQTQSIYFSHRFLYKYVFYRRIFQTYLYLLRYFLNAQVLLFFKCSTFRYAQTKLTVNKSHFVQPKVKNIFLEDLKKQNFMLSALIPNYVSFFTPFDFKSFIYLHNEGLEKYSLSTIKVLYKFEKALPLSRIFSKNQRRVIKVFS